MIFVTIGSMFPFDRLIEAMDDWAVSHPGEELLAQIGDGSYVPKHMPYERMVTPAEFRKIMNRADVIVAHAGMGSVISAAEIAKPIVLLPRQAAKGEHNTDHQLHTARWLQSRPGIFVAEETTMLGQMIDRARIVDASRAPLSRRAPEDFTNRLRAALLD